MDYSSNLIKSDNDALREKTLLSAIFDNAPYGVFVFNPAGLVYSANPATELITGFPANELSGKPFQKIFSPLNAKESADQLFDQFRFGKNVYNIDIQILNKKMHVHRISINGISLIQNGQYSGVVVFLNNVNKQPQRLSEVESNEDILRQTLENVQEAYFLRDTIANKMLYVSPHFETIWGVPLEKLYQDPTAFIDAIHPEDRPRVRAELMKNRQGGFDQEYRIIRPDGTLRWIHARSFPIKDENGQVYRVAGYASDKTERKKLEQAIHESEQRFRAQYLGIPVPTYTWEKQTDDFVLIDYNNAAERITDSKVKNLLGKSARQLYADQPEIYENMAQCFEEKKTVRSQIQYHFKTTKKFSFFNVSFVFVPPVYVMVHTEDITEQLRAREAQREIHIELERRVRVRTEELRELNNILRKEICEREQVESELRESESLYRTLFNNASVGIALSDLSWRFTRVNGTFLRFIGYSYDELMRMTPKDITHPDDVSESETVKQQLLNDEYNLPYIEKRYVCKDGSIRWGELRCNLICDKNGDAVGMLATVVDITERKKTEDQLCLAATVFDNTDEGIIITDAKGNIIKVNQAFTDVTGYSAPEVIGKNPRILQSKRHESEFYQQLWSTLAKNGQWRGEIINRRKNGDLYHAWENITAVKDKQNNVVNYVAVFSDISSIKETEQRLKHLAHHDTLTGLPNRLLFTANLDQALEHAKRHKQKVALLFLDLDRFKIINDTLGHDAGDALLKEVARRLRNNVRAEDTVARLGGDEFTVILAEISHPEDAAKLAEKIIDAISEPIKINSDRRIINSTSIGISIYPDDALNSQDLAKAADAAMYHAKEKGRNNYQFYTENLTIRAFEHFALEQELREALRREEFELYYQPQISLRDKKLVGVEALIRWHHPTRGLLLPAEFIGFAEKTGLIDPIGEWVLQTAYSQGMLWRAQNLPPLRIGVNLSGQQLVSSTGVDKVIKLLQDLEEHTSLLQLDLEITEGVLQFTENSHETLHKLKSLGIMLSIDDFGTGYSSLSRLKNLPIDTLKIDQSFVRDLPDVADDVAIATAIVALGHSLNLRVIGEGVETEAQATFLNSLGCDEVQGFYYGEPMPAEAMTRFILKSADTTTLAMIH